jgi:hypothetical protein
MNIYYIPYTYTIMIVVFSVVIIITCLQVHIYDFRYNTTFRSIILCPLCGDCNLRSVLLYGRR